MTFQYFILARRLQGWNQKYRIGRSCKIGSYAPVLWRLSSFEQDSVCVLGELRFLGGVVFAFDGWMLMFRFVSGSLCCWVLINSFFILFHANKCVVSLSTSDIFSVCYVPSCECRVGGW